MGRCWREFMLPLYLRLGLGPLLKHDPELPDSAIDCEYLADNLWLVGSPETVAQRIDELQAASGVGTEPTAARRGGPAALLAAGRGGGMSYVALVSDRFEETVAFYGERLGFEVEDEWDREHGRGRRFDLGGMRLEIIDNSRERSPLPLGEAADRMHVVIEVDSVDEAHGRVAPDTDPPEFGSWGARHFSLRDPDGVRVTFLEWQKDS